MTKFKLRGARYLYTCKIAEKEKAQKLLSTLPSSYFYQKIFYCNLQLYKELRLNLRKSQRIKRKNEELSYHFPLKSINN